MEVKTKQNTIMNRINRYITLSLLLAGLLGSCATEERIETEKTTGVAAALIRVNPSALQSRAVGNSADLKDSDEKKINLLTTIVYSSAGVFEKGEFDQAVTDQAGLAVELTGLTPGAKTILAVANAPAGVFTDKMSLSDAQAAVLELNLTTDNLIMYGTTVCTLVADQTEGVIPEANRVSVDLSRLAARIVFKGATITYGDELEDAGASLTMKRAYLKNVVLKSTLQGKSDMSSLVKAASYDQADGEWRADLTSIAKPYFYVGPNVIEDVHDNDSWENATQLVIEAEWKADKNSAVTSTKTYTVTINREGNGTDIDNNSTLGVIGVGIRPNTSYGISLNINVLDPDPVTPDPDTDITITITIDDEFDDYVDDDNSGTWY